MRPARNLYSFLNLTHHCRIQQLRKSLKPLDQRPAAVFTLPFLKRGVFTMTETHNEQDNVDLYTPNPSVRGMTLLDRDAFNKTITVPVIKIKKDVINQSMKALKHKLVQRPHLKRVIEDPKDEENKLVLLDPFKVTSVDSFEERDHILFKKIGIDPQILQHELQLTYENFKSDEILRAVLPKDQDVTSGFSRVGHIAHMNLREHQLQYRNLIGQVIADKNPGITCVVNKTNNIDSTYRNFQMEVLAGDNNMITKVKENYFTFEFDFSKVYWNPRLGTEHERIVHLLKAGDVLFDVFAGVGPFAIPAGMAVEFLDAFKGLLEEEPCTRAIMPTVHCYSFSKDEDPKSDVKEKAESFLGMSIRDYSVHLVRNVAPNKEMMCISFQLPATVLFQSQADKDGEPLSKRSRTEEESTQEN